MYSRDQYNNRVKKYGFNVEKLNNKECRFHALYFIDSYSGSLLLSKKYSNNSIIYNEDLISNFLVALDLFIKEINTNSNEEIQDINFQDTRILYERKERLIVIAITKKTHLQIEREILREIVEDFYEKFHDFINNFKGLIDPAILKYREQLEDLELSSLFKFKIRY